MDMALEELRDLVVARGQLPPPAERRAIRLRAGVTLGELARSIGVAPPVVSRWERGVAMPGRRDKAKRLLERYLEALEMLRETGE